MASVVAPFLCDLVFLSAVFWSVKNHIFCSLAHADLNGSFVTEAEFGAATPPDVLCTALPCDRGAPFCARSRFARALLIASSFVSSMVMDVCSRMVS